MIQRLRGLSHDSIDSQRIAPFLLAAVCAMSTGCGSPAKTQTPLPLIDSGAHGNSDASVQWEDNQRVVFQGYDAADGDGPSPKNISIWTVGRGVEVYKHRVGWFCAKNSSIAYSLKGDDTRRFYGVLGKESPMDAGRVLPSTCQPLPENSDRDRHLMPLLPDHGFIDRGPIQGDPLNNDPAVYYKTGAVEGIRLPMGQREISAVRYVPFQRAYFIQSEYIDPATRKGRSPWPQPVMRPLWSMTSGGEITTQQLGAPWNQSAQFYPTAAGLVAVGYDARVERPQWPDDAGLFLLAPDGAVTKLIGGQVTEVAVSPDGCSLAFFHVEQATQRDSAKLKALDLCDSSLPK